MTMLNMNLSYIIPMVGIWCGLLTFASSHKHLLNMLISLEFIMLNIFWFMTIILSNFSNELFLVLFVLTLIACEGALGLGLLVSIVRSHGNDFFNLFSFLQC